MQVQETTLTGVLVIEPPRFEDPRGWFQELWNAERYASAGLDTLFVQSNVSHSVRGVLRGMHYQSPRGQAKLVSVLRGTIYDVAVDLRAGSATFGRWVGRELSAANRRQLYIPEGLAHGFLVMTDEATVHYNCSEVYDAGSDRALAWDDPDVAIEWPASPSIISDKDRAAPRLRDIDPED